MILNCSVGPLRMLGACPPPKRTPPTLSLNLPLPRRNSDSAKASISLFTEKAEIQIFNVESPDF